MKRVCLLVFMCLALVLASCSLKQTWAVFGKWQNAEGTEIVEFSQDGMMVLENETTIIQAPFKFTDTKHMQIQFGGLVTLIVEVSVAGDELTLTRSDGTAVKYMKVK